MFRRILDFKPSVGFSATKPGQIPAQLTEKKKAKDRGFKTAPDGRLIIEDDDEDSDSDKNKKKESKWTSDSDSGTF